MLFSQWFNLFMNRLRRLLVLSFTFVKIQFNHCIRKSLDFYINSFFLYCFISLYKDCINTTTQSNHLQYISQ